MSRGDDNNEYEGVLKFSIFQATAPSGHMTDKLEMKIDRSIKTLFRVDS